MIGYKHLIECHCVLPLYKNKVPTVYHKFSVYSKKDSKGNIIPKYSNCNNCGITHLVYELCRSDIKIGNEDTKSAASIEDIKITLPQKVNDILEKYECDISTYEMIEDVLDKEVFPYETVINREILDEEHVVKILQIKSKDDFKILTETIKTIIK